MKSRSPTLQEFPLKIVGSNSFGRYPKISSEQTFNMIVSDNWLVDIAGYKKKGNIIGYEGREIYASQKFGHMIVVVDDAVYSVNSTLSSTRIGSLETFSGDVYIAENNNNQIAICDKSKIYIFNYSDNTFLTADIDFLPGYIAFQDDRFVSVDLNSPRWRLSNFNDGLSWPAANTGRLATKPDTLVAAVPVPGKEGLLIVFGRNVGEPWKDVPSYSLFPYQRSSYNFDHGAASAATIAFSDKFIAWLAVNEKSGPVVMASDGGDPIKISTDGLDFKLSQLTNPNNSYGFFFQQDGHLFYQLTFPDDELTYLFDFNKKPVEFYTLTDEHMSYHIAKRVAFFNNAYYFVSFNDGSLYELGTKYSTFDGNEMPRVRICNTMRMPDASPFVANNVTFTLEQGMSDSVQRIDLSISKNGGESYSNYVSKTLNEVGIRQNRLNWWDLGQANDLTCQFRFWGKGRFVCTNGLVSYSQ